MYINANIIKIWITVHCTVYISIIIQPIEKYAFKLKMAAINHYVEPFHCKDVRAIFDQTKVKKPTKFVCVCFNEAIIRQPTWASRVAITHVISTWLNIYTSN